MNRWEGKVAVVTGASAGIGAAIAEKLVEEGLQVAALARRKNRLDDLANKLTHLKGKIHPIETDISSEESILQAFKWIEDHIGPISILINNAGVARLTTLVNGDVSKWKEILDTNVLGLSIATSEAIKSMQAKKIDGHIVNINSICGHYIPPIPAQNVYAASKYAVTALTETLRKELVSMGSKIKVSSVSPGHVDTEIFKVGGFLTDEKIAAYKSTIPSLFSEDIANAVVYILATPPHVQITELTVRPVGEPV